MGLVMSPHFGVQSIEKGLGMPPPFHPILCCLPSRAAVPVGPVEPFLAPCASLAGPTPISVLLLERLH